MFKYLTLDISSIVKIVMQFDNLYVKVDKLRLLLLSNEVRVNELKGEDKLLLESDYDSTDTPQEASTVL